MQIVIDIDENTYKDIKIGKIYTSVRDVPQEAVVAIANGTPLPKGHGDLIDRQALIDNGIEKGFCDWYDEIKYADAIIEADKGSEE